MGTTGLMIIVHGRVAFQYGDVQEVSYIASCRKSVLSMMYGNYVERGKIKLRETMAELKIDDVGGLLPIEKTATVLDLITARSGVYHPASNSGGIPEGKEPERGKTEPGTKFIYNNWDFNVAGTVFEMKAGKSIYKAFDKEFAKPLGLQDWDVSRHRRSGNARKSIHLAYHFNFSTRDMAKIGELMLRKGKRRAGVSRQDARRPRRLLLLGHDGRRFLWRRQDRVVQPNQAVSRERDGRCHPTLRFRHRDD